MTKDEAMRIALEALESASNNENNFHDYRYAIAAIRAALEQPSNSTTDVVESKSGFQTEQNPVAYLYHDTVSAEFANPLADSTLLVLACDRKPNGRNETPLYTAPHKPAQDLIVGYADVHDITRDGHDFWVSRQPGKNTVPLYLYGHPPKIWQGLTDEEVWDLYTDRGNIFARAIEDKLKEKNT